MFKSTFIAILTFAMAFSAMAAPVAVPVPVAGLAGDLAERDTMLYDRGSQVGGEFAKRETIEIRGSQSGGGRGKREVIEARGSQDGGGRGKRDAIKARGSQSGGGRG